MNILDETLTSEAKEGPKAITNLCGVNAQSNSNFQLGNLSEIGSISNQSINSSPGTSNFCTVVLKEGISVVIHFGILDFIVYFILSMFVIIGPIGHCEES